MFQKKLEDQKKVLEKEEKARRRVEEKDIIDNKLGKPKGRAILQLSSDMSFINKYNSIAEAVRETGINSKSIRDAANGVQKHAGGYIWKYVDETEASQG